jgi:glucose/arabinose dehydrogenase
MVMNRRTYLGALTVAVSGLAGCSGSGARTQGSSNASGSADVRVETVASGLEVPWDVAFHDDSLYLTERPGRIVRVPAVTGEGESGEPESVAELPKRTEPAGEGGLLGFAFHPSDHDTAYVYQTHESAEGLRNRVLRADLRGSTPSFQPIVEGIPAASNHNGGRLAVNDDALYVTAGDASNSDLAQDRSSLAGKVLRYTLDGDPHPENPFGNPVFSYGHRNPQGLAFLDGRLYSTEHGPDHDDEINRLEPGGNYGWPEVMGRSDIDRFVDPLATYTPTIAPASAAIYDGPIAEWQGNLFFGALAGDFLGRARISNGKITERSRLLDGEFGRLRTAVTGPDDHLYVTTSNRDGRGSPTDADDRVLRIRPR